MSLWTRIFPPARRLKLYCGVLVTLVLAKSLWVWVLYDNGDALLSGRTKADLLARRQYLIERIYVQNRTLEGWPSLLPSQFQGEWTIVTYSMFASALTNIAFMFPETRAESADIVAELINRTLQEDLRAFDKDRWLEDPIDSLATENGHIGYLGHLNWMIGAYKFLGGDNRYDSHFDKISESLYRRLKNKDGMCLETYPGEVYVPDNMVVLASIAAYTKIHDGVYSDVLRDWVAHARSSLADSNTKLLPFGLSSRCKSQGGVRGSGAGWNSYYLPFIDKEFSQDQYTHLHETFLQTRIITGMREYTRDVSGFGDVDSGPVVFGFSPSGTGFAIAGAAHAKDGAMLEKLLFTAELAGSTVPWGNTRNYLLSPLVGDAILLAMKTAMVWDLRFVKS